MAAADSQQQAGSDASKLLTGYGTRELHGHKRKVTTLAWSSNGRRLASGSSDQNIRIWTPEPHCQVAKPERCDIELKGHTGAITHLAWKPGSDSILASTTAGEKSDKSIRLWDTKSGKNTASISTSTGNINVSWSPDGSSLAAINNENLLSLIDVRKAKVIKTHKCSQEAYEVQWGPGPQQLMIATGQGSVDILSLPHMDTLWSLKGHGSLTYGFARNRNNKYLVSGGSDAIIAAWDLDSMVCFRTWAHMDSPIRSVSMSWDGQYVAYSGEQGECEVLNTHTGDRLTEFRLRVACSDAVAWSPTANVLAYCDEAPDPSNPKDYRYNVGVVKIFAPPRG